MNDHTEHYIAEFLAAKQRFANHENADVQKSRQEACDTFSQQGFPTRKNEAWKYTRVNRIAQHPFSSQVDHTLPLSQQQLAPWLIDDLDCYRLVFVNGLFSVKHSQLDEHKALTVHNMASLFATETTFDNNNHSNDTFASLNQAFMQDGCYVKIAKDCQLNKPIHIIYATNQADLMTHCRNRIILEAGAQATIIESYVGVDGIAYFNNSVTEVSLAEQAVLEHYKLQQQGSDAYHIDRLMVQQAQSSQLKAHSFSYGAALARSDTAVDLQKAAECDLNGLYLAQGKQHIDHHTSIHHQKPHGVSRQNYKGIVDEQARAVFSGKVIVAPNAQKTKAEQHNPNLLLTRTTEVNTIPQLEIFADDVKCAHGATVGQLDKHALFYLRSRGISESAAKQLLIEGFAGDVINSMPLKALKDKLENTIKDISWSMR